jgi:hypothetical protein
MQDTNGPQRIMLNEELEWIMSIKERRRYFENPPAMHVYWQLMTGFILLALVILANIFLASIVSYFSFEIPDITPIFTLLLLICSLPADIALIRIIRYYIRSRPSDTQYERWVQGCLLSMKDYGLDKLDADLEEVTGFVSPVWGPVWFDTPEVAYYQSLDCPVRIKRGKDGKLYASTNKFTCFYPTKHYIAAFSCHINALHALRLETAQVYFYDDIVGVETATFGLQLDNVTYNLQQFELRVSSGQSAGAVAYGPDPAVENMVCALRMLLLNKKYGPKKRSKAPPSHQTGS